MKSRFAASTLVFVVVLAGLWQPARAQESGGPASDGRFVIEREQDGFLRLDRKTGELSFCRVRESGLTCVASAEERAAWEADIARLEDRIERIENELALRAPGSDSDRRQDGQQESETPEGGTGEDSEAEAELDRALDLAEKAWRRFADMIRQMKDDLARRDEAK